MTAALAPRAAAEAIGTAFLLMAVIGSGIMAERLSGGNAAVALLANTLATAAALVVLIVCLGPLSGAHLNPAVSAAFVLRRELAPRDGLVYAGAQFAGAVAGAWIAHAMFDERILMLGTKDRSGLPLLLSELVASFALVASILLSLRYRPAATPFVVAGTIAAAYWFTASTSFANPAATVARALSDSFAGIRPADAPGFVAAQLIGALAAALAIALLPAAPRAQAPRELPE
jgi:glycerol uptake facilitator-like aquaporin